MNIWPFKNTDETPRLEKRADAYQDALVRQLLEEAETAVNVSTGATAALEACAGLVSRAFMAAEVEASDTIRNALTPELLGMIGRALIRRGESVFDIDTTRGNIDLAPVNEYDITGGARPWDWVYSLTIAGPSDIETRNDVSEASVIHCRYAVEPSKPWRGLGPLDVANIAGKLSAETASALADEAQGPRGHFLPLPVDGSDSTITNMKADIRTARGNVLTVESGDWDNAGGNRNSEYETKRFGADPPQGLVQLLAESSREVYAACGISPSLFTDAQGTAQRESYRQFLFGVVAPLGRVVSAELTAKLGDVVKLDWSDLRAADISGRARAFQSMVNGGMEVAKAAALSGLIAMED